MRIPRANGIRRLVGNTPLLAIAYRWRGRPRTVYAKAEYMNLTGSIKDRMALHILEEAERDGRLEPGDTIVEATSGNTGIAFAAIGRALGYRVRIFMPDWMSRERRDLIATFGARILHPATALPLVRSGIPIVILNSRYPDRSGTTIEPEAVVEQVGDSPIRSISWKQGITVINIRAPRMLGAFGFLRALFEIFERHETVVDVLASGEISISITIEDRSRLSPLLRDLEELGEVWVEEQRAIIAVVGIGLRHTPGLAGRVFNAVWPANVEVISQSCSSINMTFVVRQEDGPDVVRRLHREFFGSD